MDFLLPDRTTFVSEVDLQRHREDLRRRRHFHVTVRNELGAGEEWPLETQPTDKAHIGNRDRVVFQLKLLFMTRLLISEHQSESYRPASKSFDCRPQRSRRFLAMWFENCNAEVAQFRKRHSQRSHIT